MATKDPAAAGRSWRRSGDSAERGVPLFDEGARCSKPPRFSDQLSGFLGVYRLKPDEDDGPAVIVRGREELLRFRHGEPVLVLDRLDPDDERLRIDAPTSVKASNGLVSRVEENERALEARSFQQEGRRWVPGRTGMSHSDEGKLLPSQGIPAQTQVVE